MPCSAVKRFIFFARVCLLCVIALPHAVNGQLNDSTFPNYVVIGAFAHEQNAIHFTDEAKRNKYPARFELNPKRNLFYVYVMSTRDREQAKAEALKLRANSRYFDSWVYSGQFGSIAVSSANSGDSQDFNPETGEVLDDVAVMSVSRQQAGTATPQPTVDGTTATQSNAAPVRVTAVPLTPDEVVGKNFYFHLFRADNHDNVNGEVEAIDFEKSHRMGTYPANEGVQVTMAGGKPKHISFVSQVFGYRKQQQEFDPNNPSPELYLDDKRNLVVPFELIRLQKGDIAIMYNVFFFKDAAVMRPESRYEVNNLLELLVENPSYNIVIHGHTNGNASGKIIRMDKPGNFYSLASTAQGVGSAKQLSEERAKLIRDFLVSSGVSADRMQVKAWGGKKPIHDKHSARAHENVRVEIEILSE